MTSGAWRARGFGALLASALLTHELRYQLAGVDAHAHTHGYMARWELLLGVLLLGLALEFGWRLRRLSRGRLSLPVVPIPPTGRLWLIFSCLLLAIVGGQEIFESLVADGAPGDGSLLVRLVADGGWLVLPAALLVGGACALLLRGAAALARTFATAPRSVPRRPGRAHPPADAFRAFENALARHLAGRGPPAVQRAPAH